MPIDAQRLLDGPHGRRLLLEFALRSEALASGDVTTELPLWKAVFDHTVAHPSGKPVQGWGEDHVPQPTTPEQLATRLARVPLVRARPTLLLDALQRSTRAGSDATLDDLLSHWRLDPALARVAAQVASTGKVGWWSKPLRRDDQWTTGRPDKGTRGPKPSKALSAWRRGADESGWTSAPPAALPVTSRRWPRRGPLVPLVRGEDVRRAVAVAVPRSVRVLEVRTEADWVDLCRHHPLDVTTELGAAWGDAFGRPGLRWTVPDWRALAKAHDAVHLSPLAWFSLADRAVDLEDGVASAVTGWRPGATHWLTGLPS